MKKNVAGQAVGAEMVSATDGSAFTGSVTVSVTGDAGAQATGSVGSGACTHEGNGYHTYAPAQAETNYGLIAFTFTGSGAIPVTVQVYTSFPQTGDSFLRLGAPVGADLSADLAQVYAAIDTEVAAILAAVDTEVAAIKAKTDQLTFTTANKVDSTIQAAGDFAQGAADKVWSTAARILTAGTNIALAKGTGVTGFTDLDAAAVRTAVGLAAANLDTQLSAIAGYIDTEVALILTRIGTPAGASLAADLVVIDDFVDALEARLTQALADKLIAHAAGVLVLVVDAGSTTTAVVFKTVDGNTASAVNDFYNGRVIVFTSGALAGQATSISAYVGATKTATVVATTGAPANNVTAVIV